MWAETEVIDPISGESMKKYLNETQVLVREGKHKEALNRFLWIYDHALEHEPIIYFIALENWKKLGDIYPPALEAMKKIRDKKTELFGEGKGTNILFVDVVELNYHLGNDSKTVELFRQLEQNQPEMAKECWVNAKDAVIKVKAKDLIRKYIGNPLLAWSNVKEWYEKDKSRYEEKTGDEQFIKQFKANNEDHFVRETLLLIDAALALDDKKTAGIIQEKALAILDDNRLNDAMPKKIK